MPASKNKKNSKLLLEDCTYTCALKKWGNWKVFFSINQHFTKKKNRVEIIFMHNVTCV